MKNLHGDANTANTASSGVLRLSLNAKICVAATALVVLSLGVTAAVIGVKSSASAQSAAMQLTRTTAREVAGALQTRIGATLATVISVGDMVRSTNTAKLPLQREQINEVIKSTLVASGDLVGASVSMEPDALDGKD